MLFLCIKEYSEYAKINKGGNSGMTPMIIDLEWLIRILMGKNKKLMIIKIYINKSGKVSDLQNQKITL